MLSKHVEKIQTSQETPKGTSKSSVWYENVSWLKLRNAEIYYRLPANFVKKIAMTDARIYVQGRNLFTHSSMKAVDPEVMGTQYPVFKGINVGVILNF